MRTALFSIITQWAMVISYRRFGTTYRSHLQGRCVITENSVVLWKLLWFFYYYVIQLTIKINTYKTLYNFDFLIKDHVCFINNNFLQFNILCVNQFSMCAVFISSVPTHLRTAWGEHWWEVNIIHKMRFKWAYYTDSYSLHTTGY